MRTEALGARVAVAFLPLQVGPWDGSPSPERGRLGVMALLLLLRRRGWGCCRRPRRGRAREPWGQDLFDSRSVVCPGDGFSVIETSSRFRPELSRS